MKITLAILAGLTCTLWAAPLPAPLIPFSVLSVSRTNGTTGNPALAVVVRTPPQLVDPILSATLVDSERRILCETWGGRPTIGNPCVLLCAKSLTDGEYELCLQINPFQGDSVWEHNEADRRGKVFKVRVAGKKVKILGEVIPPKPPKPKKPPAALLKRLKDRTIAPPPPLPGTRN